MSPLDLHVLGTPPAFVLSQDQTLVFNPSNAAPVPFGPGPASKLFGIFAVYPVRGARAVPLYRVLSHSVPLFLRVSLLCIVFKVRSALSRPALSVPLASELG